MCHEKTTNIETVENYTKQKRPLSPKTQTRVDFGQLKKQGDARNFTSMKTIRQKLVVKKQIQC